MEGYRNILLATDFSEHSEVAAKRAVDLAQRYGAKLTLFHVVEFFAPEIIPNDWIEAAGKERLEAYLTRDARKSLSEFADRVGARDAQQVVISSSRYPWYEILRFTKERDVDLIVLGSHGRHGFDVLLGSTTSAILQRAHCDVLVVRGRFITSKMRFVVSAPGQGANVFWPTM